jgi:hypothetical protein
MSLAAGKPLNLPRSLPKSLEEQRVRFFVAVLLVMMTGSIFTHPSKTSQQLPLHELKVGTDHEVTVAEIYFPDYAGRFADHRIWRHNHLSY